MTRSWRQSPLQLIGAYLMRILFLALSLMMATTAQAASYRLGALEVADPWSRPAAVGANGAGYMTLSNRGAAADTLVAIESPAAGRVEMHRSVMTGDMMSMQKLSKVLLPPGKAITFAPAGNHLMFIGLTKAQKAGNNIPATLVFASGARLRVNFAVGAGPTGAEGSGGMPMGHRHP